MEEGGACDLMAVDSTSSDSVKALVDACLAKHGRIDILVPNVGRSGPVYPATMGKEVWDAQMDINLMSVYLSCHFVLPIMEKQEPGGCIACISSIAGMRYIGKSQIGYSTEKAAILQFVKDTAVMYAQRGVRLKAAMSLSWQCEPLRPHWGRWEMLGISQMLRCFLHLMKHGT